jgi:hypothetical protein
VWGRWDLKGSGRCRVLPGRNPASGHAHRASLDTSPWGSDLLSDIELITIDLDDTLWPCAPPLVAAEQALHGWLQRAAPVLAASHGPKQLQAHRACLRRAQPQLAHDVTALRLISLRQRELRDLYGLRDRLLT